MLIGVHASELRMPTIGFAALSKDPALGSVFSHALKKSGIAKVVKYIDPMAALGLDPIGVWNQVRSEARRVGKRISDELDRTVKHIGSGDWWVNTVARSISRVYALKLLTMMAVYVYPPIALVAELIQGFLAKYKADFVATPEFLATAGKDDVNAFLGAVVVDLNKIDLFQTLPSLALTELSIQAQDSRKRRDDLRMEVATIQAKYANTKWVVVARAVYQAVQTIVITVVTAGAGTVVIEGAEIAIEKLIEMGLTLISAATTLLQMQMMREVVKITKKQAQEEAAAQAARDAAEAAELQKEIDRLNAEILAMGGSLSDVPPVAPIAVTARVQTGMSVSAKIAIGLAVGAGLYIALGS